MAEAIPDLWPEIEQSQVVPPVAILREQAAALGRKTNYLLEGRVRTWIDGTRFVHTFSIVAPSLDDYSYELFSIEHGADQYPVTRRGANRLASEINTGKDLMEYVRSVLNSDETKKVVGSLLAQVKATQ
jgi:hypothetical protein